MAEHHNKTDDVRAELDMWADMWDEIQEKGIHPDPESPKPVQRPADKSVQRPADETPGTAQDYYYGYLDDEQELLQEDKTPNPVYPDSIGPDYTTTPPVWASEELLKEVEKLKDTLFDVENRLASQMGGDKKWVEKAHHPDDKKLMSEIESLRKRIEKVSSQLGIENEPSPWETKRD